MAWQQLKAKASLWAVKGALMSVRRIVTGAIKSRRSVIVSDGPAPTSWCTEVWATGGDRPQGFDPAEIQATLVPPPKRDALARRRSAARFRRAAIHGQHRRRGSQRRRVAHGEYG
jgi:hypothetical protein